MTVAVTRQRIYIAAPLPLLDVAKSVAADLRKRGFAIVSTWHKGTPTVAIENAMGAEARHEIARQCAGEVFRADALVLLYGPETSRHGSILETGVALGRGLPVVPIAATADAVLPTILLSAFLRCHRPALSLDALGPDGVAYHVRKAFDSCVLPVIGWVGTGEATP